MQRFMETNEVTYNLMSFSAFKSLLLFSFLLEAPRTYRQIQQYLIEHPYAHETCSIDTVRIYLNTLKKLGCKVKTDIIHRVRYFSIESHPFELKVTDAQANSVLKVFKAISKSIDLEDFMALQSFFDKIEPFITNESLKSSIRNVSPIKSLDKQLLKELIEHAKQKDEIIVKYDSPNSGRKNINISVDKLYISNGKLYISGYNSEHENYGSLYVNRILKIEGIIEKDSKLDIPTLTVQYVYKKSDNDCFELNEDEKIIRETKHKINVEITSKNKFRITQRILSLGNKCTVLSPDDYRQEIIANLKQMKEGYFGQ